jgi:AcrR family transcriptional regulator
VTDQSVLFLSGCESFDNDDSTGGLIAVHSSGLVLSMPSPNARTRQFNLVEALGAPFVVRGKRGRPPDPELQQRRRDQILDAATKLFSRLGYHDADLQELADRLRVGKGTVYRYFPSKRELFLAAADRVMRLLHEHVEAARVMRTDPMEQVEQAMTAYLAFFDMHPEFVELLILERAVFKDRKKPTYFEHREKNIGPWIDLFAGLVRDGRVRGMSADMILDVLSSSVYGTMFTNFFAGRKQPFEVQARNILDVVLNGIVSEAERSRRRAAGPAGAAWAVQYDGR